MYIRNPKAAHTTHVSLLTIRRSFSDQVLKEGLQLVPIMLDETLESFLVTVKEITDLRTPITHNSTSNEPIPSIVHYSLCVKKILREGYDMLHASWFASFFNQSPNRHIMPLPWAALMLLCPCHDQIHQLCLLALYKQSECVAMSSVLHHVRFDDFVELLKAGRSFGIMF
jgi:hypothetical protein